MRLLACLPLALMLIACPAQAGEEAFRGHWTIAEALVGPWEDPANPTKNTGEAAYLGKVVEIGDGAMNGPALLGCGKTEFVVEDMPFAGLFEGGLGTDPANPAAGPSEDRAWSKALALGFSTEPVSSMSHGCSEIPLHLRDRDTILFALDNRIYVMTRRR